MFKVGLSYLQKRNTGSGSCLQTWHLGGCAGELLQIKEQLELQVKSFMFKIN